MNIYQNIKNNNKIYLIFGGFASQPHHFTAFFPDNLIILYHYQNLDFAPLEHLLTSLAPQQMEVYAFSMGVWVANLFLQNYNPPMLTQKTAINGTEFGIDTTYGIPLKVFKITQKFFNLEHFKANLLGRHSQRAKHLSFLDEESLRQELGFFISNHKNFQQSSTWDRVIISKADLIFPTISQELFWVDFKGYQKQILWLDSPHFVFFDWKPL